MNWTVILDAATGRAEAINRAVRLPRDERAALGTLLLLEEAPHPAAALIVAETMGRCYGALPTHAALATQIAAALAAWRADPQWADRAIGDDVRQSFLWGVAVLSEALRAFPAARRDAVDIVVRDGDAYAVVRCIEELDTDVWRALSDDRRAALLARMDAADLGRVWAALDDAQRAAAAQRAADNPELAALLVRAIGAAAWSAVDPALRERVIDAVVRQTSSVFMTAPSWAGMTDDERDALASAVVAQGDEADAFRLLQYLGSAGRATLTAEQRAAIEARARNVDPWRVLNLRAVDLGWTALPADERRAALAAARRSAVKASDLLRAVGAAGWTAMSADERERLASVVRRTPNVFFRCPPALWSAIAGAALPPAMDVPEDARTYWRAEDADADLGALPPAHQALVLALAPWRPEDATKDSVRVPRLCVAWNALTGDERVALVLAHPSVLAQVAAAARLHGGAAAAAEAVGATVARWAAATGGADAHRAVGAMLRTPADWRDWMVGVAPSDGDPPDVWEAWIAAARRGVIPAPALCARLAAKERESGAPARPVRRPVRRRGGRAASS